MKSNEDYETKGETMSSPTRGMWIEILWMDTIEAAETCHPPRGGCGLKCNQCILHG